MKGEVERTTIQRLCNLEKQRIWGKGNGKRRKMLRIWMGQKRFKQRIKFVDSRRKANLKNRYTSIRKNKPAQVRQEHCEMMELGV